MEFIARELEIQQLHDIRKRSSTTAQLTVVTGRRRIGKTSMVLKAFENETLLYFFVARKTEAELCQDFTAEIVSKLNVTPLGKAETFTEIFTFLINLSKERQLNVMIDEFQDFLRVNKSVFSDMQRIWDLNKNGAKMNLIVCGSINTLMNRLFRDKKEPLYGRQTEFIRLEPFLPSVLKGIMKKYHPQYTNEDLLAMYLITGGVPKYVELLVDTGAVTKDDILNKVLSKNTFFLEEGKNILIEEFGRDYAKYFEILCLIASGHTRRTDIEGIMRMEIGGYITRLDNDYEIIEKHKPMMQKSDNKNIHYAIRDNFLRFWFRFIYKYNYVIEANAFGKLRDIVNQGYTTYSGHVLERYFKDKMREEGLFTRIDSWWDRKGEIEIDIITTDDLDKKLIFYEVKRQASNIKIGVLRDKAALFLTANDFFKDYAIEYKGLSMEEM